MSNRAQERISGAVASGSPVVEVPASGSANALSSDDSAVLESESVSKASAGRLFQATGFNNALTAVVFQVHNRAAVPVAGNVPVITFEVPSKTTFSLSYDFGKFFNTGITWAQSTTLATYTAPATDDMWVNVEFN